VNDTPLTSKVSLKQITFVGVTIAFSVSVIALLVVLIIQSITGVTSRPPLVESWSMEAGQAVVVWGEGNGIPLVGQFDCKDVTIDTAIQFKASVSVVDSEGETLVSLPAAAGAPIPAGAVCDRGERSFVLPWSSLPENWIPDLPVEVFVRYSAEAAGFATANTRTESFAIVMPPL